MQPDRVHDPTEDVDALFERGQAKRREILDDPDTETSGPLAEVDQARERYSREYLWGAIWSRPGLDMQSRVICTLSGLTVPRTRADDSDLRRSRRSSRPDPSTGHGAVHASVYLHRLPLCMERNSRGQRGVALQVGGAAPSASTIRPVRFGPSISASSAYTPRVQYGQMTLRTSPRLRSARLRGGSHNAYR